MKKNKKIALLVILLLFSFLLTGCKISTSNTDKLNDITFTVVPEEEQPEELRTLIEEKKEEVLKLTFQDDKYLYICVGYGKQEMGGYSITVNELYLTENAIYIDTNLLGPTESDEKNQAPSYPYVVVKMEYLDKTVVFD